MIVFQSDWFAGLNGQETEQLRLLLVNSDHIREKLISILQGRIDRSRETQQGAALYEKPNWALAQADAMGYQRALTSVIQLLQEYTQ